ncbi:EscG/YscG/SsaH family type III secretion system needle protein co-chaperone [Vibrio hepatarius]|uniref:EscG/YscG/SsaH family type III secretion system needle protein co-chaperone n=1 Tax=Vibrio hepatarius TaxID=171383 RepID=UPI001C096B25|nr:EscG/YscG/SsaH family type III secretion system needle protein co-chaperone [Vibrio hepatarius]MBU2898914.1 EscG/YscG/SsaH family type III secretion system needle protein co-chaperone [Vibrio hepatarius]
MKSSDKQLLVEAALAAANHRLEKQAVSIMAAFPHLIEDEVDRRICESLIYFALGKRAQALRALNGLHTEQAEGLRFLYTSSAESADMKTICSLITGGQDGDQCNS